MLTVKKIIACVVIASLFLVSCVSHRAFMLPPDERNNVQTLGIVSVKFGSFQPLHIKNTAKIERRAHDMLLKEAKMRYGSDVDVVNIVITGSYGFSNYLLFMALYAGILVNHQTINATGEVVRRDGAPRPAVPAPSPTPAARPTIATVSGGLDNAVATVSSTLIHRLPQGATIAVLNISSNSDATSKQAVDELEYLLVNSGKFVIVDRKKLDEIRAEQKFQMSGEVDDNTVVEIGRLTGAGIVLTGQIITRENSGLRLSVKALELRTGNVLSMERADF